ncbi:DUF7534 family protein [Natronorubrum halophilum]|uniref:DUF7534 family protein n=1 Tax=Natronorubrum halophilum TaxID=1702106 RepID=UPI0010C180AF|nr:hypothetical protein [Natronorubrum halophilum]
MNSEKLLRFSAITLLLSLFATMIAAIVSPPDPFAVVFYALPLLLIAPIISYIITYKNGTTSLREKA